MSKDHDQDKKPEKKQEEKMEVVDQSRRRFLGTAGAAFATAQAASVGLFAGVGSQALGEDSANIKAPPGNRVVLPQLPQRGVQDFNLDLPDSWEVEICQMLGHDRPEIDREDIRRAIRNPIGTPTLQELAKGKKEVAILFDDYARGTKWPVVAAVVLKELALAGIKDENIRFICACGCHSPANRTDFVRKLGEEIVSRYAVYNHNGLSSPQKSRDHQDLENTR